MSTLKICTGTIRNHDDSSHLLERGCIGASQDLYYSSCDAIARLHDSAQYGHEDANEATQVSLSSRSTRNYCQKRTHEYHHKPARKKEHKTDSDVAIGQKGLDQDYVLRRYTRNRMLRLGESEHKVDVTLLALRTNQESGRNDLHDATEEWEVI